MLHRQHYKTSTLAEVLQFSLVYFAHTESSNSDLCSELTLLQAFKFHKVLHEYANSALMSRTQNCFLDGKLFTSTINKNTLRQHQCQESIMVCI